MDDTRNSLLSFASLVALLSAAYGALVTFGIVKFFNGALPWSAELSAGYSLSVLFTLTPIAAVIFVFPEVGSFLWKRMLWIVLAFALLLAAGAALLGSREGTAAEWSHAQYVRAVMWFYYALSVAFASAIFGLSTAQRVSEPTWRSRGLMLLKLVLALNFFSSGAISWGQSYAQLIAFNATERAVTIEGRAWCGDNSVLVIAHRSGAVVNCYRGDEPQGRVAILGAVVVLRQPGRATIVAVGETVPEDWSARTVLTPP